MDDLDRRRLEDLAPPGPRRPRRESTPRFLGLVVDGGAIPTGVERYALLQPVRLDGGDVAGASWLPTADASRAIPVVWLGPKAPHAGDLAVAHAVGGRWVADRSGDSDTVTCSGCEIPKTDLTLTTTNSLSGVHSVPLAFDGVDAWETGCTNQIIFRLACAGGVRTFGASHFVGGSCPSGSRVTCTGGVSSPSGLTLTTSSCSPLLLEYSAAACASLAAQGYTKLAITL